MFACIMSILLSSLFDFYLFSLQLAEMNGKMVVSKPLYVALAQRKEERRAKLQVTAVENFLHATWMTIL